MYKTPKWTIKSFRTLFLRLLPPPGIFQGPLNSIPNVINNRVRLVFGFIARENAASHKYGMPGGAIGAGVLICAKDVAGWVIWKVIGLVILIRGMSYVDAMMGLVTHLQPYRPFLVALDHRLSQISSPNHSGGSKAASPQMHRFPNKACHTFASAT